MAITDAEIREFQRSTSGALFAACTMATEGTDAERAVARPLVETAINAARRYDTMTTDQTWGS